MPCSTVVVCQISCGTQKNSCHVHQFAHREIDEQSADKEEMDVKNNVNIIKDTSNDSRIMMKVNKGNLLLLADVSKKGSLTWNKVLLGKKEYGWILRVVPPKFGVPEKRLTITYKFNLRYLDMCALLIGLLGFAWGFVKFRIRTV